MSSNDISLYVHVIGFVTGIVLYVMLGIMAWQGRGSVRWPGQAVAGVSEARDPLLLLAVAALGVLLSISANILHLNGYLEWHTAISNSWSWVTVAGYALLMGLLVVYLWRGVPVRRTITVLGIVIFAVSAGHLVYVGRGGAPVPVWIEMIVHYAPIPLVAWLLYQQYRFALADVFLKRTIGLLALVVMVSGAYLLSKTIDTKLATIGLWLVSVLLYPTVQSSINRLVDRGLLRRMTTREVRAKLSEAIDSLDTAEDVLNKACILIREAVTARWVTWNIDSGEGNVGYRVQPNITVAVPVAEVPRITIGVGELAGGRRLLSGDMDLLEIVAFEVARKIDVIRMSAERYDRERRETEVMRLAAEAELQALQAQLNPHFLFNALTTIGYLIEANPERAKSTLLKLTELLRAVLRKNPGEFVRLSDELSLVDAYLAIEKERFEERLEIHLDVSDEYLSWPVLPLSIQPLVENAIKHGISPLAGGGSVTITVEGLNFNTSNKPESIRVTVLDTGVGVSLASKRSVASTGVGLENIERRLQQIYGAGASLSVRPNSTGKGTTAEIVFPRAPLQNRNI